MRRYYITTIAVCLTALLAFSFILDVWRRVPARDGLTVGFLYENDEGTPYTYNFYLARLAVEKEYGDRVKVLSASNVRPDDVADSLRELVRQGCDVVFTNTHSDQVESAAVEYPEVEFCQLTYLTPAVGDHPANYHTFNGRIYEGRYATGVVAGMKLRELIDRGELAPEEALVGFVGPYETPEVISGFTAFLLGVHSAAPEAVLRVRCTDSWNDYAREKSVTEELIREGCVVIAQHTGTVGPALACEEAGTERPVYYIGYNQSMAELAPSTTLVSLRVNCAPYVVGAVGALLDSMPIERVVEGTVHDQDMAAGFDRQWVELLELNQLIAAPGTEERIDQLTQAFQRNRVDVFRGDYLGVNPSDPSDTYDLNRGYTENEASSAPTFGYILEDVVTVER